MPAKAQRFKSTPTPNSARRYSNGSKTSPRTLLLIRTSPGCAKSPFIASMRFAPTSKPSRGSAILKERSRISEPSSRNSFKMSPKSIFRVGVDTGGTFTDFVVIRDGKIKVFKELSTPQEPEEAIMKGLARAGNSAASEVIHGSTVATNALLERKGARTALLTTEGFEDILVIGRQTRRELYNIFVTRPDPLVPAGLRMGVRERTLYDGSIATPLDQDHLQTLINRLRSENVESVAVCLLYSFANTEHENKVLCALEPLRLRVSLSSRILPEYREYERTSTTVINAYLAPLMSRYLTQLTERLPHGSLRVMQSNGGTVQAKTAADAPVRTILSGPAGGVVGAFHVAEACGYEKIITFDMGGTSTDVSLCEDEIKVTHESQVDGMPVGIPMMDIHTVGAGGGSRKRGRRSRPDLLRKRRAPHSNGRERDPRPLAARVFLERSHETCNRSH